MKALALALLLMVDAVAFAATSATSDANALQARATAGNADAQFRLGEAYRAGRGVNADTGLALMWYRRAAAQGHVRAAEELGFALFAHGDRREAMPYIEAAAARGEARAFYLLGTAHFNGDYAARDWPLAYAQTMRAAAANLPAAQRNLEVMDRYLLPTDIAKAQQILATLPPLRAPFAPERIATETGLAPSPPAGAPIPRPVKAAAPVRAPAHPPVIARNAPPATPPPAIGGPWRIQLGAYSSTDHARSHWQTLLAKVPLLAGHGPHIVAVGPIQRLQADAIADRAAAQSLCKAVQAAGGECFVLAP